LFRVAKIIGCVTSAFNQSETSDWIEKAANAALNANIRAADIHSEDIQKSAHFK